MPDAQRNPHGLRLSSGSWAIIARRFDDGSIRWMGRWNTRWNAFNFAGGHVHANETFRECLVREIVEELNLNEGEDYRILEPAPLRRLEYEGWSVGAGVKTWYDVAAFGVRLDASVHYNDLLTRKPICWLLRSEIESGVGCGNEPVSATMRDVLTLLDWVAPGVCAAPENP